jgi:hypothetical protein
MNGALWARESRILADLWGVGSVDLTLLVVPRHETSKLERGEDGDDGH